MACVGALAVAMRRAVCVAVVIMSLATCGSPAASPTLSGRAAGAIPVLGTENFYADLLAQIGGTRVSVSTTALASTRVSRSPLPSDAVSDHGGATSRTGRSSVATSNAHRS